MAAFDDGTPLDAAALQDLDRRLVEVKALIPTVGSAVEKQTGDLKNSLVELKAKQIVGGISGEVKLSPGKNTPFTLTFSGVTGTPTAVILTPIRSSDIPAVFSYAVDEKTLSNSKVQCRAYLNSGAKAGFSLYFYYILIVQ